MRLDARIPVRIASPGRTPAPSRTALLLRIGRAGEAAERDGWAAVRALPEAAVAMAAHGAGCPCCRGRSGLADALGQAFAERARTMLPWFDRVVLAVPDAREQDVVAILEQDALLLGRFRAETEK